MFPFIMICPPEDTVSGRLCSYVDASPRRIPRTTLRRYCFRPKVNLPLRITSSYYQIYRNAGMLKSELLYMTHGFPWKLHICANNLLYFQILTIMDCLSYIYPVFLTRRRDIWIVSHIFTVYFIHGDSTYGYSLIYLPDFP